MDLAAHHPVFVDEQGDLHRLVLGGVVGELVGVALYPPALVLGEVKPLVRLKLEIAGIALVKFLGDEQLLGGDGLGGCLPAQAAEIGQAVVVVLDVLHLC